VLALVIWSFSMCGIEQTPARAAFMLYGARGMKNRQGGDSMRETNDALWLAFEALAKTYPHDDGVRMTADIPWPPSPLGGIR
jgi:hypothetical protein